MPDRSDFWSRRRSAVAAEEQASEDDAADESHRAAAVQLEEKSDAELLEFFGLPDPETLGPADAARFMAREIPARLRRRAFRSLFRNHPHLSVPDGLQDYDLDYTDAAVRARPAGSVWSGAARGASAATKIAGHAAAPPQSSAAEDAPVEPARKLNADPAAEPPDPSPPEDLDDSGSFRPRRMVFRFDEPGR